MVKIKSIKRKYYKGKIYDITLKNNKSPYFYANKILTHNSLYPHIMIQCNLYGRKKEGVIDDKPTWAGGGKWKTEGVYYSDEVSGVGKLLKKWYGDRVKFKEQGDRREYTIKIIINCFDKDTEIFTVNGPKNIKDCKVGDKVYSINPKTLELEVKPIEAVTKRKYNNIMHEYKSNQGYHFKITPEHKFLLQNPRTKKVDFVQSKNLYSSRYIFPKHNVQFKEDNKLISIDKLYDNNKILIYIKPKLHGRTWRHKNNVVNIPYKYFGPGKYYIYKYKDIKNYLLKLTNCEIYCKNKDRPNEHMIPFYYDLNNLSELFGWFISEGGLNKIKSKEYKNGNFRGESFRLGISQSKEYNYIFWKEIKNVFNKLNIKHHICGRHFTISNSIFYKIFLDNFGKGAHNKKISKKIFSLLNKNQLQLMFETMFKGDGTKNTNHYGTVSTRLKNDFCKLILLLGGKFSIKEPKKYTVCWTIFFDFKERQTLLKYRRKEYQYNDYIYNVSVKDNHTVLAGSNGRFNWIGQTVYGLLDNAYYTLVYDQVAANDCTRIGRQWTKYARQKFREAKYKIIYTDTDSIFILDPYNDKERMLKVKDEIINDIKLTVPFSQETFDMTIDDEIKFIYFFKESGKK